MINSHRKLCLLALGLIAVCLFALPALGQELMGCPVGSACEDAASFDAGVDGWVPESASTLWLETYTLGLSQESGILSLYDYLHTPGSDPMTNYPGLYKSFYLQPGQYQLRVRAGQDLSLLYHGITMRATGATSFGGASGTLSEWGWTNLTFGPFTVYAPGEVRIQIVTDENAYFDYIYLEQTSSILPTATPGPTLAPGQPTHTPTPTYVPTEYQATPMPTGTPDCQPGTPDPSTGIPVYPTAGAPYTGTTLGVLEIFDMPTLHGSYNNWSKIGSVELGDGDHTGAGSYSAYVKYNPHWGDTTAATFDNALVMTIDYGYTTWLNAWAQADVVPTGESARAEIWELVGGTWSLAGSGIVSARVWYPLHAEISSAATAIAFVSTRSDLPGSGYIMWDDIYLYAPEGNKPYCSGQYPTGTIGGDDVTNSSGTRIEYPANKPCPGGIMEPNNIWGMLLTQMTLWLDRQMAMAPIHVLGQTRDLAQQFMLGPMGALILIATIILDWQVPIIMLGVYLAFQAGLALVGVWKTIRRTFVT